jgi:hypothetical protein
MKIIRDGAPAGGFSRSSPCCLRVHCADLSHLDLAGAMRATGESYLKLFLFLVSSWRIFLSFIF